MGTSIIDKMANRLGGTDFSSLDALSGEHFFKGSLEKPNVSGPEVFDPHGSNRAGGI